MSQRNPVAAIVIRQVRPNKAAINRAARRAISSRMESLEERRLLSGILGTAQPFAALAGSTVTNTGSTVLYGDLGVSPGNAITGFPPGVVSPPSQTHITDAVAQQAEADAATGFGTLAGMATNETLTGQDLGGLTLTPGVYTFATSAQLTGTLTLDAQNNPNAMFVFQIGTTLTTASASSVQIINEPPCFTNVFWQVGSSATLGTGANFDGAIVAYASITLNTGATITDGNALALNGAVTMGDNTIAPDPCGSISGLKFQDTNGNGVQDAGEPGVAGVTMFLDTNGDGILDNGEVSTVTDASGDYLFPTVNLGTYSVREAVPTGWIQTTPNPAAVLVSATVMNVAGGDFGDFQLGQITGNKFQDTNGNGVQGAGEPGLTGVTMFLDTNGDGILDNGEVSTVTDASGNYDFPNVGPGTYSVREVVPTGWIKTTANPPSVVMSSDATLAGGNFGDFQLGTISGNKFQDTNGDGIREAGEPGFAGVTIFLDTNGDGILDNGEVSTVTDASGNYSFVNLGAGTYSVREVIPSGWTQTTPNPLPILIASGGGPGGVNFGDEHNHGQIIGAKFQDTNGDGIREAGEPGVAGVTVFLDANGDGILDNGEVSTITTAGGGYVFSNVLPGTYTVREVEPAGWIQTTANPPPVVVTSVNGVTVSGGNFGNFQLGKISGVKFLDACGSAPSTYDTPLAGITIKLYRDLNHNGVVDPSDGAAIQTTVSGINGAYSFSGLTAGAYVVSEVNPSGYLPITPTALAASIRSGSIITGKNFYDFKFVNWYVTGVSYTVTDHGVAKTYSTLPLNGEVNPGDTVTANFTVPAHMTERISLVSYTALSGNFQRSNLSQQTIYQVDTGIFGPGKHSLTVIIPNTYFQLDLVAGCVIPKFGTAGSNIFYSTQKRLIGSANDGLLSISGNVFNDLNSNGMQNAGETGLSGWTVYIDGNDNGKLDSNELSVKTDASGNYALAGLKAGKYIVRLVAKSGYKSTTSEILTITLTASGVTNETFGVKQIV